jgi:hypothetical protein
MNGRAAKRIRIASAICRRPVRALKREYMALPYHRRAKVRAKQNGVARTHREVLRASHAWESFPGVFHAR